MKPKKAAIFQTAGKTQLPKRPIVGKDRATKKVLAGKSVIFAFCSVVGSKGRTPPAAFYEKAGYRFPEKVAVASERQSGSFLEQDSTAVNFRSTESFNPCPERATVTTTALWKPSSAD